MATYESKKYDTPISDATKIADGSVNNTEFQYINSLSSNAQTQITARLPLAGGTMTGDLNFGDNVDINFGDGTDLKILHDGSNSIIQDAGTGDLVLAGDNVQITNSAQSENQAIFTSNGAVELYHNNAKKIETSATGVTITGVAAATTVTGDGSGLTALNGSNISSGTVADARISTLTASKLTGALPAIDGSNLTGLDVVPSAADSVGAIRAFALFSTNTNTPTDTTISATSEITPATYESGSSAPLQLAIDPPVGAAWLGFSVSGSRAITGKTRTTVSGTWRALTTGQLTSSDPPGPAAASASSTAFLAQRIS
jgi:hypothetical protein